MKTIAAAYEKFVEGLALLSGLIIAGICLLIVYDVISRNLGLQPPASTVALTEYALLYFTMFAAPWLVRTRGHIVVEVMHSRLHGAAKAIVDRIILAICLAVSVIICGLAAMLTLESIQRGNGDRDMPRRHIKAFENSINHHEIEIVNTPSPIFYDESADEIKTLIVDGGSLVVVDPCWFNSISISD